MSTQTKIQQQEAHELDVYPPQDTSLSRASSITSTVRPQDEDEEEAGVPAWAMAVRLYDCSSLIINVAAPPHKLCVNTQSRYKPRGIQVSYRGIRSGMSSMELPKCIRCLL